MDEDVRASYAAQLASASAVFYDAERHEESILATARDLSEIGGILKDVAAQQEELLGTMSTMCSELEALVLFVGGTAEQCIAAAVLQQKGVRCSVVSAGSELGFPWISIPFRDLMEAETERQVAQRALPPGVVVLFAECRDDKLAITTGSWQHELTDEVLAINSPLLLISSTFHMEDYYCFLYAEEPLTVCNGKISQTAVSVSALMRSDEYTIAERRNILRFLKIMEQYIKAFHLSYVELINRDDPVADTANLSPQISVLRRFEEADAPLHTVQVYFKLPPTFFSQLLCQPSTALANLTFANVLKGVIDLLHSLDGHNSRTRCALEYGLSDIPQSFVQLLFCYGGLGLTKCALEASGCNVQISLPNGEPTHITPTAVYICGQSHIDSIIQVHFVLRDHDNIIADALKVHIRQAHALGIDDSADTQDPQTQYAPGIFVCILSNCVAKIRLNRAAHMGKSLISVSLQVRDQAMQSDAKNPTDIAESIKNTAREELPRFMGLSADQFREAECAVVATKCNHKAHISAANMLTEEQMTQLSSVCKVVKYSIPYAKHNQHQDRYEDGVSEILLCATKIIKQVLNEEDEESIEWVHDMRRSKRIEKCRSIFSRPKSGEAVVKLDDFEADIAQKISEIGST